MLLYVWKTHGNVPCAFRAIKMNQNAHKHGHMGDPHVTHNETQKIQREGGQKTKLHRPGARARAREPDAAREIISYKASLHANTFCVPLFKHIFSHVLEKTGPSNSRQASQTIGPKCHRNSEFRWKRPRRLRCGPGPERPPHCHAAPLVYG